MAKTAVEAPRAGNIFTLPPEDERFVLVTDKKSALYDERLELPVSEELALSIAREGQMVSGKVRKNGPNLELLDGRQRFRACLLVNEWVNKGEERVAFRAGQTVSFKFEVIRPEDEADCVRKVLAANLRVEDTPLIRARRVSRALKWGCTEEDVRVAYGFKNVSTIKDILQILDCAPAVQKAVDSGDLPEYVARDFVGLDKEKQSELLTEMKDKGITKGQSARRAVKQKKKGQEVTGKAKGKKMLSRTALEGYLALLEKSEDSIDVLVAAHIRLVLGDADALNGERFSRYKETFDKIETKQERVKEKKVKEPKPPKEKKPKKGKEAPVPEAVPEAVTEPADVPEPGSDVMEEPGSEDTEEPADDEDVIHDSGLFEEEGE